MDIDNGYSNSADKQKFSKKFGSPLQDANDATPNYMKALRNMEKSFQKNTSQKSGPVVSADNTHEIVAEKLKAYRDELAFYEPKPKKKEIKEDDEDDDEEEP